MEKPDPACLPNLFTIGAAKSGTTSLHNYLDAHPEISMSTPKEPALFASARWQELLGQYGDMFSSETPIRGESTILYTFFPVIQNIPERVAATCPNAKLIYIVRDPVERVAAHYVQLYGLMLEHRSLGKALWDLDQPANRYVAPSRYAAQLEQWLEHFDRERILVLDQLDLRNNRVNTIRQVLEFLEVSPVVPSGLEAEFNSSMAKERMTPAAARLWFALAPATRRLPAPVRDFLARSKLFPLEQIGKTALDPELRAALAAELAGEAARFRELTGMEFASWTV